MHIVMVGRALNNILTERYIPLGHQIKYKDRLLILEVHDTCNI